MIFRMIISRIASEDSPNIQQCVRELPGDFQFMNTNPRRVSSVNTLVVDRIVHAFGSSYG